MKVGKIMQVYFFTRTGRSKEIAEKIATEVGIVANEITDDQNWNGAGNYIKGGYMSSTKKTVPIHCVPPAEDDDIILVFPIWAAGFPPAIRAFLEGIDRSRVILLPTSLVTKLGDREGFKKIIDLVGKEITPLSMGEITD